MNEEKMNEILEDFYKKIMVIYKEKGQELEKAIKELEEEGFNPYPIKMEDEYYYQINSTGNSVIKYFNHLMGVDYIYNGFNSEEYAELRKREIDLQDRMWEFSYKNGWKDEYLLDRELDLYLIYYDRDIYEMCITNCDCVIQGNEVYFISEVVANKAIKEFGDEFIKLINIRADISKGVI